MTTQPSAEPGFLTNEQVNSAILTLRSWSSQAWTDEDAHVWRHVLRSYRAGELSTALDHWQRTAGGRFRPRPGDLAPFLKREANHTPYKDYAPPEYDACPLDFGLEAIAAIRAARLKVKEADGG